MADRENAAPEVLEGVALADSSGVTVRRGSGSSKSQLTAQMEDLAAALTALTSEVVRDRVPVATRRLQNWSRVCKGYRTA